MCVHVIHVRNALTPLARSLFMSREGTEDNSGDVMEGVTLSSAIVTWKMEIRSIDSAA